jgi:hypothetical protein
MRCDGAGMDLASITKGVHEAIGRKKTGCRIRVYGMAGAGKNWTIA